MVEEGGVYARIRGELRERVKERRGGGGEEGGEAREERVRARDETKKETSEE